MIQCLSVKLFWGARTFICLAFSGSCNAGKSSLCLKLLSALTAGVMTLSSHAGFGLAQLHMRHACIRGGVSEQHGLRKAQSNVFTISCRTTFAGRLLLSVCHLGRPCGGLCRLMRMLCMLCEEWELSGICNTCSSCKLPWVSILLRAVDVPTLPPCSCTAAAAPFSGIDLGTSLICAVACLPFLAPLPRAWSVDCDMDLVLTDAECCTAIVSAGLPLCNLLPIGCLEFCCGWPSPALLLLPGVCMLLNPPSRERPEGVSCTARCACL